MLAGGHGGVQVVVQQPVDRGLLIRGVVVGGGASPGVFVNAPDLQAALAIAKGCPHLDRDGGVEVGELADLQPDARPSAG